MQWYFFVLLPPVLLKNEIMELTTVEIVGYLASLGVLTSFMFKDMRKLRIVNSIGCILFIIYGLMMPTLRIGLPIIITNAAIVCLNIYYLFFAKSE